MESESALVLMELPLFKDNFEVFMAYAETLRKKIICVITDYHEGYLPGVESLMPKGVPAFLKGELYTGMMAHFKERFGEKIVELHPQQAREVSFGEAFELGQVRYIFRKGVDLDFPCASIIIGNRQVYYSHWAFRKTHPSPFQINSLQALDAEIMATKAALASGCKVFVGGHGGVSEEGDVAFRLEYLQTVKKLRAKCANAEELQKAIIEKYVDLSGAEGVGDIAKALYKNTNP